MISSVLTAKQTGLPAQGGDLALAPDVLFLLLDDGSARLLDLAGKVYAISGSGGVMVHAALTMPATMAARALAAKFAIGPERLAADLRDLLDRLEGEGLIRRAGISQPAGRGRASQVSSAVLTALLGGAQALPKSIAVKAWVLLAIAYGAVRLFGLAATVAVWQRHCRQFAPSPVDGAADDTAHKIDAAVRAAAARHPLVIACKERALCCWALMRHAGLPAEFILGVEFFPFASHCWCQLGTTVLGDAADRCKRFTPVLAYY